MAAAAYGALLDAVRGVRWPARRPAPAGPTGAHLSRARGAAPELAEYRAYRQGDEPRRIDWKLLARSDRAFVRLAPDRAVLPTRVVVDASASMAFAGKWSMARRLAVAIAAVANGQGDPVGLVVPAAARPVRLPPRTRRSVVAEVAQALDGCDPSGTAPLADALLPAAARTVVITDALGDEPALRRAAATLAAAGRELWLVHVVAREELEPPAGAHTACDPEDPAVHRPLVGGARGAYQEAFAAWRDDVARGWRSGGCGYLLAVDDEAPEGVVRRLAAARA